MNLYDSTILKSLELAGGGLKSLPVSSNVKNLDEKTFIFPDDSAVELGATGCDSGYLIAYTTDKNLVSEDEILLRGKDIKDLSGDVPFARIAIILIDEDAEQNFDKEQKSIDFCAISNTNATRSIPTDIW